MFWTGNCSFYLINNNVFLTLGVGNGKLQSGVIYMGSFKNFNFANKYHNNMNEM